MQYTRATLTTVTGGSSLHLINQVQSFIQPRDGTQRQLVFLPKSSSGYASDSVTLGNLFTELLQRNQTRKAWYVWKNAVVYAREHW